MSGYFGDDAATAAATTAEGAIRTGDLGRIDERGRVFLTGRLKDLIISGGLNIALAEIEAVACEHPGVQASRRHPRRALGRDAGRRRGPGARQPRGGRRAPAPPPRATSFKARPPPRWSTCCRPPASASPRRPSSGGRSSTGRSSLSAPTDVATLLARHGEGLGALARAITQVENSPPWQVELPPVERPVHVVGITGLPGAGKSTLTGRLIEAYANAGARVGVLAIDLSSPISGGAVLGDRLRMEIHLLGRDDVFVRSLASRGSHGAIAGATRNVARLLELSGSFDVILIETVGATTEVAIAELADTIALVTVPGLGDAVQAIKAGLMEAADMVVVNMADRPGTPETVSNLRLTLGRDLPIAPRSRPRARRCRELRALFDALDAAWATATRRPARPQAAREAALIAEVDRSAGADGAGRGPEHRGQADPLERRRDDGPRRDRAALDVQRWREERLARDYERVPPRREQPTTLSGLLIDDVYTPADVGHRSGPRHRAPPASTLHARPAREHVPRPPVDDPPGRRVRPGRGHQRRFKYLRLPTARTGSRPTSTCRRCSATT